MAVSHGSCRGRALRRPYMLHSASPKSPHVHPYSRGPPSCEATLPDMGKHSQHQSVAANLVPSGPFGFAAQDGLLSDILFLFQKSRVEVGNARNLFDLMTNHQQAELFSVPGSKRYNAFWGEFRLKTRPHPTTGTASQPEKREQYPIRPQEELSGRSLRNAPLYFESTSMFVGCEFDRFNGRYSSLQGA